MSHQCSDDLTFPAYVLPSNQGHTRQTSPSVPSLSAHPRAGVSTMGWKSLVVWECEMNDEHGLLARLHRFLGPNV